MSPTDKAFAALVADVGVPATAGIDMMVNNAMAVHYAPIERLTLDDWRKRFLRSMPMPSSSARRPQWR